MAPYDGHEERFGGCARVHLFAKMFHVKHSERRWEKAVEAVAASLERSQALSLSEGQRAALVRLGVAYEEWAIPGGLLGLRSPETICREVFLDSLLACGLLVGAKTVSDLGSGAGVPGLPLAIGLPDVELTLVDRRRKAISFLEFAIARLGLPNVRCLKAEAGADMVPESDAVVSRCLTSPDKILPPALTHVGPSGKIVLWVRRDFELAEIGDRLRAGPEPEVLDLNAAGHSRRFLVVRRTERG